jgi:hypothetical protein
MQTVAIIPMQDGNLAFSAPYNPAAVEALKGAIPSTDRKWDKDSKHWVVLPGHVLVLTAIAQKYYGQKLTPPARVNTAPAGAPSTKLFRMTYLGRAKDRGNGEAAAFGYADGTWRLVFPEQTLRDWFGVERRPGEALTLYNVLAVKPDASGSEIKTSWRKLIRTWHPDVSREPDAAQQFHAIQAAYEVLSDPARRARYDAGLALERTLRSGAAVFNTAPRGEYRAPLTCGYVMVEGSERLDRFVVSTILEWQDITRNDGAILVTSWPEGADMFIERWVRA